MQVWPGSPYPLGANFDGSGTNFAVFSSVAHRVTLCLFDADGGDEGMPDVGITFIQRNLSLRAVRIEQAQRDTMRDRREDGEVCAGSVEVRA